MMQNTEKITQSEDYVQKSSTHMSIWHLSTVTQGATLQRSTVCRSTTKTLSQQCKYVNTHLVALHLCWTRL